MNDRLNEPDNYASDRRRKLDESDNSSRIGPVNTVNIPAVRVHRSHRITRHIIIIHPSFDRVINRWIPAGASPLGMVAACFRKLFLEGRAGSRWKFSCSEGQEVKQCRPLWRGGRYRYWPVCAQQCTIWTKPKLLAVEDLLPIPWSPTRLVKAPQILGLFPIIFSIKISETLFKGAAAFLKMRSVKNL